MQSTRILPDNYRQIHHLSIANTRVMLAMNIVGLVLLVAFGWLFLLITAWLRPQDIGQFSSITWSGWSPLIFILEMVVIVLVVLVVHEAIHGLGFLLLARVRPVFAFRGTYAYAAAPGWYIPRPRYFPIALAPLVVISLVCIWLIAIVPAQMLAGVILAAVMNASGAVGDIWAAVLLLRSPAECLSIDAGDEIDIYAPAR